MLVAEVRVGSEITLHANHTIWFKHFPCPPVYKRFRPVGVSAVLHQCLRPSALLLMLPYQRVQRLSVYGGVTQIAREA